MSSEYWRRKEKRPASNDVNNTFVKNMTSRVSGLVPSTIKKWFGSPNSSNANGSAPIAESKASSSEDEALENEITPPPSKKVCYSPSSSIFVINNIIPETKCTDFTETVGVVKTPASNNTLRSDKNFSSTPLQSSNEETVLIIQEDPSAYIQNSYSNITNKSIVRKRKSLFDEPVENKRNRILLHESNPVEDHSQSHFKSNLCGSPFYPGVTRYGGASSFYMNQPNIKQRKDTLVTKSPKNETVTLSHSSRCVLDLLENYSSPLIEAKWISKFDTCMPETSSNSVSKSANKYQELNVPSIAKILRIKKRTRLNVTTSAARQIIASNSSSPAFNSHPVQKIQSDKPKETFDKLTTKMRAKLTRIDRDKKSIEVNVPVHLPTAVLQIDENNLPKFTFGNSITDPSSVSTTLTSIEATTNTIISTTGNNSITAFNAVPISPTRLIKLDSTSANITVSNSNQHIFAKYTYKFSSPSMIHVGTVENSQPLLNFTFGSPEWRTEEQSKEKESSFNANQSFKAAQTETWKCDDCYVSKKFDSNKCVCCGAKKPLEKDMKRKQCSVCNIVLEQDISDICINCSKKIDEVDEPVAKIIPQSKWKCQDCWVNNDEGVEKCICCGEKKSQEVTTTDTVTKSVPKWKCLDCWVNNDDGVNKCECCGGNKPQELILDHPPKSDNVDSDWRCDICLVKNMNSADVCVACGGPKSTYTQKSNISSSAGMGKVQEKNVLTTKKVKSVGSGEWLCQICLVKNGKDRSTCICCEADKPGRIKESERNSFNFGSAPNMSFKFGIDPNQNVFNKISESSSHSSESIMKESESNNNISKSATFTFGIPNQKVFGNTISEGETKAKETPIKKFTFGLSEPSASSTLSAFSLFDTTVPATASIFSNAQQTGNQAKLPEITPNNLIENDKKVQEVPNVVEHNSSTVENLQKPVLFGMPLTSSTNTTATAPISFGHTEQIANIQVVPAVETTVIDAEVPQKTFNFAASSIRPGLFTAVSPAATTTSISFPAIKTPTTSSISFFQNSEPVCTSSIQFFSKSDPVPSTISFFNNTESLPTTTSLLMNSTAPVLTFSATNSQNEKPKFNFNFTFGKNSKPASLFNMATTNTGTTLSGNGLSSGSTASNIISGENLATRSSVESNNLPSNTLTSGLVAGPVTKENIMWPSNNGLSPTKMSSGNNIDQGIPAMQTSNPFSVQTKKENIWWQNTSTPNETSGSLKLPAGNTAEPASNSGGVATGGMFGTPDKKENMWSLNNNNSNMFVPNAGANTVPKPAIFSFGSSMQFNTNNMTSTLAFGSPAQPSQNIFGMSNQVNNNNQSTMFSSISQNQASPSIFGAQAGNSVTPPLGMFGTTNTSAPPSFGTPPQSIPSFEATVPTPTFNFGAHQTTGVFGFGQQPAQPPTGVYNFGTGGSPTQFNIGTAGGSPSAIGQRRIKRALRRTNPR